MKRLIFIVTMTLIAATACAKKLGGKWDHTDLTYYIGKLPQHTESVEEDDIYNAINGVFGKWAANTALTFTRVYDRNEADITVEWGTAIKGGTIPFVAGDIGHGYPPDSAYAGEVVMNDAYTWTVNTTLFNVLDIEVFLLHEVGHTLGLGHSDNKGSVMHPDVMRLMHRNLHVTDVCDIWDLYGCPLSIAGSNTICDEETYTVDGLFGGAKLAWGYKGGSKPVYPPVVIKSEDGATAVYERGVQIKDEMEEPPVIIGTSEQTNSSSGTEPYVGTVTITAAVTLGGNTYVLEKEVTMNEIVTPDISGATKIGQSIPPGSMPIIWYPNKTKTLYFVYTGSSETGLVFLPILYYTNIDWEVTHPDGTIQYGSGRSISITPKTHGRLKVKITDGNQCRLANSYTAEYLITPYLTQLTFTNPASGSVDISVKETAAGTQEGVAVMSADAEVYAEPYMGEYMLELWHEVYGMVREMYVEAGNPTVTVDLGGLTPGWYYVRLIADGEMKAVGKLMVR